MTNKQIIRAAAERLDPATLHQIATAHHTPEEIAAVAASCKIVDKDGNEKPATAADIEIMFAADELHTFDYWKKEGKSVKKGEKAAAEGKEAAPDPHYYPTKSHLFSCLQVESSRPAPQARFKSTAEIIAYNKQLAAERKAAKEAAAKAAAEVARPAPVVVEEHHELPELVHVEPLPTKPAPKKPRTTKKPAADVAELKKAERKAMHEFMAVPETDRAGQAATLEAWRKATATRKAAEKAADEAPVVTVSMEELEPVFEKWYSNFYRTHDDNDSKEYRESVKTFDQKSKNDPEFSAIVQQFTNYRCDFISSDREAAAFVMALDELNHKHNAPEMVPSVQQLDFASIAAGVLA